MRILIVGCGYVGSELLRILPTGWHADALTRSASRSTELRELGANPIVMDWLEPITDLQQYDYILVAVPHREVNDFGSQTHVRGLKNLLNSAGDHFRKIVYLSTTGVFGTTDSEQVTEDTPVSPSRVGPTIAVQAENFLTGRLNTAKLTILRLAGIYGPGRIPLAAKIRAGEPLAVPQSGFLNLVHVSDIARMIINVLQSELKLPYYLFSDGNPVRRLEFYEYLAHLCGVTEPEFVEPTEGDARARRATSKRIDPSRIIQETGFEYRYPNYRAGLEDAIGTAQNG